MRSGVLLVLIILSVEILRFIAVVVTITTLSAIVVGIVVSILIAVVFMSDLRAKIERDCTVAALCQVIRDGLIKSLESSIFRAICHEVI